MWPKGTRTPQVTPTTHRHNAAPIYLRGHTFRENLAIEIVAFISSFLNATQQKHNGCKLILINGEWNDGKYCSVSLLEIRATGEAAKHLPPPPKAAHQKK